MKIPTSPKGRATRSRILNAALACFASAGFEPTTIKDIAQAAEVSTGLIYRYFPSKDALLLGFYEQMSEELALQAESLPRGRLGIRFKALVEHRLERLGPYRDAMQKLVGLALDPASSVGVLSPMTARIRERNAATHRSIVEGAIDVSSSAVPGLPALLYAVDLLLLLAWVQDPTPDQRATHRLLDWIASSAGFLPTAMLLPPVQSGLRELGPLMAELLSLPKDES
ncbi:MAG: TetR/AcrR family transcriptional regulator [Myxococcota bacterium]